MPSTKFSCQNSDFFISLFIYFHPRLYKLSYQDHKLYSSGLYVTNHSAYSIVVCCGFSLDGLLSEPIYSAYVDPCSFYPVFTSASYPTNSLRSSLSPIYVFDS
jgi:hypothetical protein